MTDPGPNDPFADVQRATRQHLDQHGCGAYTYADGSLPGVMAAAAKATRIVEIGTALGYSALWLAYGSRHGHVDTIEYDATHVQLARDQIGRHGYSDRISVHHGQADQVLARLDEASYDVGFFDGFAPTSAVLAGLGRLLRPYGVLIVANLTLGPPPAVTAELFDARRWLTHSFGETAICVKQGDL